MMELCQTWNGHAKTCRSFHIQLFEGWVGRGQRSATFSSALRQEVRQQAHVAVKRKQTPITT